MAGKKRLFSEIMGPPESAASTSHDIVFKDAKKNLLDTFTSTQAGDPGSDHMKCYLRIRPMSSEEIERGEDQKCLEVEGENSVITHAPKDSHAYKNYTYGLGKTNTKFTFSKIFSENTTQKEFFDRTMLGLARDFIDGQNCLVFSYGITSSGKTYTIQGKPHDAGLLPRVLDVLFNSIEGKQWPGMDLKPVMFTDVKKLSPEEEKEEKRIKEKTLRMSLDDDTDVMTLLGDDISDMSQGNTTTASEASNASTSTANHKDSMDSDIFAEVQNRVREEAAVSVEDQGQIKFSVWVSFAEIYNEQIFDLLEPIPKKKNARRNILKLSDDKNGSPYIKGLREINVSNADEAYRLLSIGQRNLRTACTKLNQNSSRSHCIFNIKVLRVVNTRHPRVARISMLSLCDLAGSERQSKTQAVGVKLTEASNINTSLMMLGRCIEALRYNQTHKDNQRIVPFRDSKLTRIFQNFFSGQGKAAMIINVSPSPTVFDETLRVFKFSAIAKQVIVLQKPKEKEPKVHNRVAELSASARPSIQWASPGTMLKFGSQMNVTSSEDNDDDEELSTRAQVEELLNIVDFLQKELRSERASKLHHEAKIREEVCKEMMAQMVEIEDQYSERLRECDQMAEELVEKRVKLLMEYQPPPKRQRQDKMTDDEDEWVSSVLLHAEEVKVKQRDEKITGLEEEVSQLKNELMNLSHIRDSVTKDKTAFEFALADKKRELLGVISDKEKAVDSLHTAKDELNESKQTINTLQKQLKQAKRQSVETSIQKELEVARTTVDELQEQLKQALSSVSDTGDGALLESLSQQLQTARETQKKQEQEIEELNEMLSEAGETFQQKEQEIARLKTELLDGDKKINEQEETIKRLRQALEESTRAVQESEIRLQHKTERISALVEERQQIQGSRLHHTISDIESAEEILASQSPLPDYVVEQERSRVLRVVVTPIQKLMAKHTKTSLLRQRTTPTKNEAKTLNEPKKKMHKETSFFRRKFMREKDKSKDENVQKKRLSLGSKLRRKSKGGAGSKQKYNLRTRMNF